MLLFSYTITFTRQSVAFILFSGQNAETKPPSLPAYLRNKSCMNAAQAIHRLEMAGKNLCR